MPLWKQYMEKPGWRIAITSGKAGTGDWKDFDRSIEDIHTATEDSKDSLRNIERPWLCWNNNDNWCILQQKLVIAVGWTPVVGWDPNCTTVAPKIVDGSIAIDFNRKLKLSVMWPHFPIEFAFMWAPRLAFWHSDLLVRIRKLNKIALLFNTLKNGEVAAVRSFGGMRNIHKRKAHRYWELLGCTTSEASRHQFKNGCGWWRNFHLHPNTPEHEVKERSEYYREHGVGIMYWKRKYHRCVYNISERAIREGHFTQIGNKDYVINDDKGKELSSNFNIEREAKRLGLSHFL